MRCISSNDCPNPSPGEQKQAKKHPFKGFSIKGDPRKTPNATQPSNSTAKPSKNIFHDHSFHPSRDGVCSSSGDLTCYSMNSLFAPYSINSLFTYPTRTTRTTPRTTRTTSRTTRTAGRITRTTLRVFLVVLGLVSGGPGGGSGGPGGVGDYSSRRL